MKTIKDKSEYEFFDEDFYYQPNLTTKLDKTFTQEADQNLINEIVLWKVNRYVELDSESMELLNHELIKGDKLDIDFTRNVLEKLLSINGIRLAMASTILRFRNPNIYQIIDQRAYRYAIGEELTLKDPKGNQKEIESQIDLYLKYLNKLSEISLSTGWPFSKLDRILYVLDKKNNKDLKIKYS